MEQIKKAKYEFHSNPWDKISEQAKDLIKSLLNVDPKARFTPFQSLTHPWITNVNFFKCLILPLYLARKRIKYNYDRSN